MQKYSLINLYRFSMHLLLILCTNRWHSWSLLVILCNNRNHSVKHSPVFYKLSSITKQISNIYQISSYFKFTSVFFLWMFLRPIKEINCKTSFAEQNRFFSKLRFSKFKKFASSSVFGEFKLAQISLNFTASCCILKIRDLGKKRVRPLFTYVLFLRYLILNRILLRFSIWIYVVEYMLLNIPNKIIV